MGKSLDGQNTSSMSTSFELVLLSSDDESDNTKNKETETQIQNDCNDDYLEYEEDDDEDDPNNNLNKIDNNENEKNDNDPIENQLSNAHFDKASNHCENSIILLNGSKHIEKENTNDCKSPSEYSFLTESESSASIKLKLSESDSNSQFQDSPDKIIAKKTSFNNRKSLDFNFSKQIDKIIKPKARFSLPKSTKIELTAFNLLNRSHLMNLKTNINSISLPLMSTSTPEKVNKHKEKEINVIDDVDDDENEDECVQIKDTNNSIEPNQIKIQSNFKSSKSYPLTNSDSNSNDKFSLSTEKILFATSKIISLKKLNCIDNNNKAIIKSNNNNNDNNESINQSFKSPTTNNQILEDNIETFNLDNDNESITSNSQKQMNSSQLKLNLSQYENDIKLIKLKPVVLIEKMSDLQFSKYNLSSKSGQNNQKSKKKTKYKISYYDGNNIPLNKDLNSDNSDSSIEWSSVSTPKRSKRLSRKSMRKSNGSSVLTSSRESSLSKSVRPSIESNSKKTKPVKQKCDPNLNVSNEKPPITNVINFANSFRKLNDLHQEQEQKQEFSSLDEPFASDSNKKRKRKSNEKTAIMYENSKKTLAEILNEETNVGFEYQDVLENSNQNDTPSLSSYQVLESNDGKIKLKKTKTIKSTTTTSETNTIDDFFTTSSNSSPIPILIDSSSKSCSLPSLEDFNKNINQNKTNEDRVIETIVLSSSSATNSPALIESFDELSNDASSSIDTNSNQMQKETLKKIRKTQNLLKKTLSSKLEKSKEKKITSLCETSSVSTTDSSNLPVSKSNESTHSKPTGSRAEVLTKKPKENQSKLTPINENDSSKVTKQPLKRNESESSIKKSTIDNTNKNKKTEIKKTTLNEKSNETTSLNNKNKLKRPLTKLETNTNGLQTKQTSTTTTTTTTTNSTGIAKDLIAQAPKFKIPRLNNKQSEEQPPVSKSTTVEETGSSSNVTKQNENQKENQKHKKSALIKAPKIAKKVPKNKVNNKKKKTTTPTTTTVNNAPVTRSVTQSTESILTDPSLNLIKSNDHQLSTNNQLAKKTQDFSYQLQSVPTLSELNDKRIKFNNALGFKYSYFSLLYLMDEYVKKMSQVVCLDFNLLYNHISKEKQALLNKSNLDKDKLLQLCKLMSRGSGKINYFHMFGMDYKLRKVPRLISNQQNQLPIPMDENSFFSSFNSLSLSEAYILYDRYLRRLTMPYSQVELYKVGDTDYDGIRVTFENQIVDSTDLSIESIVEHTLHKKLKKYDNVHHYLHKNYVFKSESNGKNDQLVVKLDSYDKVREQLNDDQLLNKMYIIKLIEKLRKIETPSISELLKHDHTLKSYVERKEKEPFYQPTYSKKEGRFKNHLTNINSTRGKMMRAEKHKILTDNEYRSRLQRFEHEKDVQVDLSNLFKE